jgi:hypothetical protein
MSSPALALIDLENAALRSENASLKRNIAALAGEVGDLAHQIARDRKARGVSDGAALPEALKRPTRAATKRKGSPELAAQP